jgi:hypothetical protein
MMLSHVRMCVYAHVVCRVRVGASRWWWTCLNPVRRELHGGCVCVGTTHNSCASGAASWRVGCGGVGCKRTASAKNKTHFRPC